MRRSVLVLAALLASACQSAYQPSGLGGGYSESQVDENTWRVNFAGNTHTPQAKVDDMLLYRCAELTAKNGFDYFVVVESNSGIRKSRTYAEASPNYGTPGASAWGVTRHAYGALAMIKVFHGEKPANDPGAYDARSVMKFLGPSIGP